MNLFDCFQCHKEINVILSDPIHTNSLWDSLINYKTYNSFISINNHCFYCSIKDLVRTLMHRNSIGIYSVLELVPINMFGVLFCSKITLGVSYPEYHTRFVTVSCLKLYLESTFTWEIKFVTYLLIRYSFHYFL